MSFNSSREPLDRLCIRFQLTVDITNTNTTYNQVTFATCIVTALLAPMALAGNAFILAAIWKNPSLRSPPYVLLAGLAITDFCTGTLTQPFFTVYKLGEITGNRKLFCIGGLVTEGREGASFCFCSLTFAVITMAAVERWLHMSRRTLLTVRRVVVLYMMFVVCYLPCLLVACTCGIIVVKPSI